MVASGYIAKNNIMEWLIKTRLLNNLDVILRLDQVERRRAEKKKAILREFDNIPHCMGISLDNPMTISGDFEKGKHVGELYYGYLSRKVSFWLFKIQKFRTFSFNYILHLQSCMYNSS